MIYKLLALTELFLIVFLYKRRSKLSGKHNRDITQREYEKCRIDCIVLNGTNCDNEMLYHVLEFKEQTKSVNKKNC